MAGNILRPVNGVVNEFYIPEFQIVIDVVAPEINVSATTEGTKSGTAYYAHSGDTLTLTITDDVAINGISLDGSINTTNYMYCWGSGTSINSCGTTTALSVVRDDNNYVMLDRLSATVTVPDVTTGGLVSYYLFVYLVNDYVNNVATAIDSYATASPYVYYYFSIYNGQPSSSGDIVITGNAEAEEGYTNTTQLRITYTVVAPYGYRRSEVYFSDDVTLDDVLVAYDDVIRTSGAAFTITLSFDLEAVLGYAVEDDDNYLCFTIYAWDVYGNNDTIGEATITLDQGTPEFYISYNGTPYLPSEAGNTGFTMPSGNSFEFNISDDSEGVGLRNTIIEVDYYITNIAPDSFDISDYYNQGIFNMQFGTIETERSLSLFAHTLTKYYVYIALDANELMDLAGNRIGVASLYPDISGYIFLRYEIGITSFDATASESPVNQLITLLSSYPLVCENKECGPTKNMYQLNYRNTSVPYYLLAHVNVADYTNMTTTDLVGEFLTILRSDSYDNVGEGLTIINSLSQSLGTSSVYKNSMTIQLNNADTFYTEVIDLAIIMNTPELVEGDTSNSGSKVEVEYGSEVSNVGMSFVGEKEGEVKVETLITLNGVKVKEIDTKVAGVYSITQVARDSKGRSARVVKEVIVKENEEVETNIKEEEEIVELVEVVAPVTNVNVSESVNEVATREVVETNQVTMRVERKVKVRGYSKKKEVRKTKKEKFSFKLFSKYFFKIYDG